MLQVDEKMVSLVQDIVVSYETQISLLGPVIDSTYEILQESEGALAEVHSQLRKTLADNVSLRKKDYDSMIAEIESRQEEGRLEIKRLLNEFILVHRKAATQLKELIADARSARVIDFRTAIAEIQTRQDEAQEKVLKQLKSNQEEQEEIIAEVHGLLNNGNPVKVKDFKAVLGKLKIKQTVGVC